MSMEDYAAYKGRLQFLYNVLLAQTVDPRNLFYGCLIGVLVEQNRTVGWILYNPTNDKEVMRAQLPHPGRGQHER